MDIEINMLIEKENNTFMASSPDINVYAEGKTIDEAKNKFISGVNFYFEDFPEDKEKYGHPRAYPEKFFVKIFTGGKKELLETPMIQKIIMQCQ